MSLWRRIRDRLQGVTDPAKPEDAAEPAALVARAVAPQAPLSARPPAQRQDPFAQLRAATQANEREVLAALSAARGTSAESEALVAVASAPRPLPDRVALAVAEIFVLRGQDDRALELLSSSRSAPLLMMQADLHAARGDIARAIGAVERVLSKAIDTPGALERRERWAEALGVRVRPVSRLDEATVVTTAPEGAPFVVLREVARGGAGTVYEARDELLGRRVAFKVYHGPGGEPATRLPSGAGRAVEREARVAARFAGPGVVRVLDVSAERGWVALEWIGHGSLKDALKTRATDLLLPLGRWLEPLTSTLARIHAAGWVHGDVKPANVLFRRPGEPVLTDFGIAREGGAAGGGGSAGYVAPERLAGASASARDDVYGVGRVMEDAMDALGIADLEDIVAACLAPAEDRPADCGAVLRLLRERTSA